MKTSISTRLFLAVLSTALFVALTMGVADSWSFARGFLGYLNELAVARMESVEPRFVEAHGGSLSARPSPLGGLWLNMHCPGEHTDGE